MSAPTNRRPAAPKVSVLPHRKPQEGRDYWVLDGVLPDAMAVRQRLLARKDWIMGFPHRQEGWPGMRAVPALEPAEVAPIEAWVREKTGARRLFQPEAPEGARLDHNCVQLVGIDESGPRPHTDSRKLCRYAAVLYMSPNVPASCGTTFYRVRMPNGQLGGNTVPAPHSTLVDALGTRFVPPDTFVEDLRFDYKFNRLLMYRADIIHSASGYWGIRPSDRRMTVVFFWMS